MDDLIKGTLSSLSVKCGNKILKSMLRQCSQKKVSKVIFVENGRFDVFLEKDEGESKLIFSKD